VEEWNMTGGELAFLGVVVVGMLIFIVNLAAVSWYTADRK
jgi:hypothetical protein